MVSPELKSSVKYALFLLPHRSHTSPASSQSDLLEEMKWGIIILLLSHHRALVHDRTEQKRPSQSHNPLLPPLSHLPEPTSYLHLAHHLTPTPPRYQQVFRCGSTPSMILAGHGIKWHWIMWKKQTRRSVVLKGNHFNGKSSSIETQTQHNK